MFFDNWSDLAEVAVLGALAYAGLIVVLRVSGKRTLAKMNAFDLVVTIAMGSILATMMLSDDVTLVEGAAAFVVLIALQFTIAWLSVRSTLVRRIVKSEPALMFHQGEFLDAALRAHRVTRSDVRSAVRAHGEGSLAGIECVVLEPDGSLNVVARQGRGDASALLTIAGYAELSAPTSTRARAARAPTAIGARGSADLRGRCGDV